MVIIRIIITIVYHSYHYHWYFFFYDLFYYIFRIYLGVSGSDRRPGVEWEQIR